MNDEDPPSLTSSAGPPPSAFGRSAPPPSAFGNSASSSNASADLSSRWKQYEAEKTSTTMVGPDGPDYDLYETPEKQRKPSPGTNAAPRQLYASEATTQEQQQQSQQQSRRSYSLTKSSSYNTEDLIAKYSSKGRTGAINASNALRRSPSSGSAIPSAARAEAVKVLAMADEHMHMNQQAFSVRRTESGGFRASAGPPPEEPFSFQRNSSSSRRTPSALSGLGLNKARSTEWKSNRYAFSDPKFREDDYLEEEEDQIVHQENEIEVKKNSYRDNLGEVAFDGDFPRKSKSSWSSRYSDNPSVLDKFDRTHSQPSQQARSGAAKNMIRNTASNVGNNLKAISSKVKGRIQKKKDSSSLKGYSFKDNKKSSPFQDIKGTPAATGLTNLRTVWKDDAFHDEEDDMGIGGGDHKQHKTWEQVAMQKKRRRKILASVLCLLVAATIIGVTLSKTAWRWKYSNLWKNGNTHMDVTFYVTSNTPLGYGSTEAQITQDLANIPSDAEFVAHLGNLQDASVGMCPAARMTEVASLLKRSPVPVYVVPGEHDWVRCPDQSTSFGRWLEAFASRKSFEDAVGTTTAASAGEFDRPKTTPDVFSKLHHGVLFFGLHLVSGHIVDRDVQEFRDEKMAVFVRGTLDRLRGEYRSVILLGNARPGPQQQQFFDSIREDLTAARVPVAYVHSHSGFGETEHYPFGSKKSKKDVLSGMVAIQAASGGHNQPPLKITVGFGKRPFAVGEDSS